MDTIEDIIRAYIPFTSSVSSKGWNTVYCEVCGDGRRVKGPRGGWLFQEDMCFYSCFNCGVKGNFSPDRDSPHSKDMYNIFRSFGVPAKEVNALLTSKIKDEKVNIKRKTSLKMLTLPVPDFFVSLNDCDEDDILAEEARHFLWESYRITQDDHPFFLSSGKSKDDNTLAKQLRPRLIIPSYSKTRMVYWQARIFVGESKRKYISATVKEGSPVMYGLGNMYADEQQLPLYVTEGFADSWHVNGVGVAGNTMKPGQVTLLERIRRPKVIVPDYNLDGMHLAEQAIDLQWGISLPDIMPNRDLCTAILQFGKLYVLKSVVTRTYHGFEAKMRLKDFKLQNYNFLNGLQ
jgi:hypothetical protein